MNAEKARNYLLLEQSGELSSWGRWRLARYLKTSPEARRYLQELQHIATAVQTRSDPPDMPDWSMARILDEARRAQARRDTKAGPASLRVTGWRPALAFAGLALLLVAGWLVFTRPPSAVRVAEQKTEPVAAEDLAWEDGVEEQMAELGELLAMAPAEADDLALESTDTDLDEAATELMRLEGSQI